MTQDARAFNWDSISPRVGSTANPAAGVDAATITVPAVVRWKVYSISQNMVTAVAAANRYPYVQLRTASGAVKAQYWASKAVTASLTIQATFSDSPPGGIVLTGAGITESMPSFEALAGDLINFYWLNLQGADDGGIVYYVYKEAPA